MCYLQRNLKRLLAFSTISHVGLMLTGIGLIRARRSRWSSGVYVGAWHGERRAFLVAGILLHRFQTIDEQDLHGKGRGERWTGRSVFLGAPGWRALPFSGLAAGHVLISASANTAGYSSVLWIFLFAGAVTAAAVFRAGGRIFFGWGPVDGARQRTQTRRET